MERSRGTLAALEGKSLPEAGAFVARLRAYARANDSFAPVMARFGALAPTSRDALRPPTGSERGPALPSKE